MPGIPVCSTYNTHQVFDTDKDANDGHDCCTADSCSLPVHFYEYHIVYLPSYSVPVLLFKAQHEGKSSLCVYTFQRSQ